MYLTFDWDMAENEFNELMKTHDPQDYDERCYCGACFVGKVKIEFWIYPDGSLITDTYVIGYPGEVYAYTEDGLPYVFLPDLEWRIPKRRTFYHFRKSFEDNVMKELKKKENEQLFKQAGTFTWAEDWYYGRTEDVKVEYRTVREF